MKCCEDVRGYDCPCAQCHLSFSSLTLFDRHQDVKYGRTPTVTCRAPAGLGLVEDYRGTWTTHEAAKSRQRSAEAMAARNRERDA